MSNRNLTSKDILQKEFKPALRGFNTQEVDEFLNLIIRDYESYDREIAYLKTQNERLKQKLERSKSQGNTENSDSERVASTTNYDIIKRLSRLEKTVYGVTNHQTNEEAHDSAVDTPDVVENDGEETQIYRG
ncbi:MAG: cell division regulator GpsB [Aerococcus sp.]|nr:cell division regulator GpsB [Aerococcus sp.]